MAARLLTTSFSGLLAPGTISVTGLKVGDLVVGYQSSTGLSLGMGQIFGPIVVVDGELLQSVNEDLSALTFQILVEREVMLS